MTLSEQAPQRSGESKSTIHEKIVGIFLILSIYLISTILPHAEATYIFCIASTLTAVCVFNGTFITYLFCAQAFVIFVVPTVLRWYFYDVLFQFGPESYVDGLEYCSMYFSVFAAFNVLVSRINPMFGNILRSSTRHKLDLVVDVPLPAVLALVGLSLLAKLYLHGMGMFRSMDVVTGESVFTGTITAISECFMIGLMLLGLQAQNKSWATSVTQTQAVFQLYFMVAIIGIALGFLSGSRMGLIQIFLVIAIVEMRRNVRTALFLSVVGGAVSFYIFQFLLIYRNVGFNLEMALDIWSYGENSVASTVDNIFADRMNYARVVQRVVESARDRPDILYDYSNNVFGLIPRAIWPDKPVMGLDLNDLAKSMGFIDSSNHNTSIGLSVVGESYFQLKEAGLLVGAFQGIVFALLYRFGSSGSALAFCTYITFSLILVVRDSYIYIVPLMVTYIAVVAAFAILVRRIPLAARVRSGRNDGAVTAYRSSRSEANPR